MKNMVLAALAVVVAASTFALSPTKALACEGRPAIQELSATYDAGKVLSGCEGDRFVFSQTHNATTEHWDVANISGSSLKYACETHPYDTVVFFHFTTDSPGTTVITFVRKGTGEADATFIVSVNVEKRTAEFVEPPRPNIPPWMFETDHLAPSSCN